MKEKKVFKILSIDGGGIKGLYSASILEKFEKTFNCLTTDHFDMICGTSTGGLIALAISTGIPAKDICNFYETKGHFIFPNYIKRIPKIGNLYYTIKQSLLFGKYSNKGLKSSLKEIFGENKIGDSKNLLCIPSYSVTKALPRVFKFDHKEGELNTDNNKLLVDVALATSAAPTYFPLVEIENNNSEQFIDGGVWANNPTLVGLIEALDYFVGEGKEYNSIQILSISSLNSNSGRTIGLRKKRSFWGWKDKLFETSLIGQSHFADFFLKKIKSISEVEIDYIRIPNTALSVEQEKIIQLDNATKKAYNNMKILGAQQASKYERNELIKELFTTKKTYKI